MLIVQAEAVPLQKILSSNLQMIVPIFQREYTWDREIVRVLWEDVIKLYNSVYGEGNTSSTHFLGPIVRAEVVTPSVDIRKFWLIDGQQRVTTLMVLLSCLRNYIKESGETSWKKIESGYLMNYEEDGLERYKLVPSEGDQKVFKDIVDGKDDLNESKLKDTFDYFNLKISATEDLDLEKLRGLIINNLFLVSIDTGRDENPYLIFESLNGKGTPLTQADLIRNYIFMKINDERRQKELYDECWRDMEIRLGNELNAFFWKYSLKDGTFVKMRRTYANLKMELETNNHKNAENELKKLHEYSLYYEKLIYPEKEENEEISKRLARHNQWEITTEYPFLLNLYRDYADKSNSAINAKIFCEILDIIESFVVRRFFCRYPTNKLNQLFIRLYSKLDPAKPVESLKDNLWDDFPEDDEFREEIKDYPIYLSGYSKCSLVLKTFERNHGHKEPVESDLQIEHIMPQASGESESLPDVWKEMLGSRYPEVHSKFLHTLGNLTLTGYNPELGQKSFDEKKQLYKKSHITLNDYFENIREWNEDEIQKRAEILADQALDLWKTIE